MRYVGKSAPLAMRAIHIRPGGKGFVVQLTKPLAANQAIDPSLFSVKRYHYLYTGNYGSPQANEKQIPVESAELSSDRTSITLTLPVETHPLGMVYELRLGDLADETGEKMLHKEAWYIASPIS
jgi:hypothetical protein